MGNKNDLEKILTNIHASGPFERIRNGNSLPIVAISKPLYDQNSLQNEKSKDGAIDLIEAIDNARPKEDIGEIPVFILGGAISDWRFNFTKKEGPRNDQTGYTEDWDFSQEAYGDLKLRLGRLSKEMEKFPESASIYYTFSLKDDLNIEEMYSYAIQMFALGIRSIYRTIKKESVDIHRICTQIENMEVRYRSVNNKLGKKKDSDYEKRTKDNSEKIQAYESERLAKIDKSDDLNEDYNKWNDIYKPLKRELKKRQRQYRQTVTPEVRSRHQEKIRELKTKIEDPQKHVKSLERKINTAKASIEGIERSINTENKSYERDKGRYDKNFEEATQKSNGDYFGSIINKLEDINGRYKEKRDTIDRVSSYLATEFNVPNMSKFKDKFDNIAIKYEEVIDHISDEKKLIEGIGFDNLESIELKRLTGPLENYHSEFQKLFEDFEDVFSIRDREGMLTKREIPQALREQIQIMVGRKYREWLEEALSGDGKLTVTIKDRFSNNFYVHGPAGNRINIRAGGYASKWDSSASGRSSVLNYIERMVKGDFEIYRQIENSPFEDQFNDPEKLTQNKFNKTKIDLMLIGGAETFQVNQIAGFNSPHSTYVCTVGPFYDTFAAFGNKGKGARTLEQKEAAFATSGLLLLDIDEFGIVGPTIYGLDHLKKFKNLDYKTVPGYHTGDDHFGAGNQNKNAMHGLISIISNDDFFQWWCNTGDIVDGQILPFADFVSQFEGKLQNIANQMGKFINWQKPIMDKVLENSELVTKIHFSQGQHDRNRSAVSQIQTIVDVLNAPFMSEEDRLLYETNKRKEEKGFRTVFDDMPVQLLVSAHEGVGYIKLRYADNPDNTFAEIFVSHNLGLNSKGSFMSPTKKSIRHRKQKRFASSNMPLQLCGDKHLQSFGMGDSAEGNIYVSMNAGFISNDKQGDNPFKVVDGYGWRYGSELRTGLNKIYVPFNQHEHPHSALLVPQSVLEKIYKVDVKPKLEKAYQKNVTLQQQIAMTT